MQQHSLSHDDLRESFRLFEKIGNVEAQAHVAIELGNVQYYLNRPDRAHDHYEQALELAREVGAAEAEITALSNMALSRRRFGRTSEKRKLLLEQARRIDSRETGALGVNTLLNLAEALNEIEEAAAAERVARRALEVSADRKSEPILARGHRSLARAYSLQGRHEEAFSACRTALDRIGSNASWTAIGVHWGCGNVFLDGGRTDDALELLREAVRIGEGVRAALAQPAFRASFLSDRTNMYADLVQAVLTRAGPDPPLEAAGEALAISERFRAWTLLDALAGGRRTREEGRSELLAMMAEIHLDMLSATPERRVAMIDEIRRLEDRLASDTVRPRTHVLGGSIGSERDLRELLPDEETAFLEYLLGYRAAFAFVVTRKEVRVAELPRNREQIREEIVKFRSLIRRRGPDPEQDEKVIRIVGERLYRSLITPAEQFLGNGIRRLVICPDGALHLLPFDALVAPGDGPEGPLRYLMERYQISVVPSLTVLSQLQHERPPDLERTSLAAFANPRTPAEYPPLPYSEEEVRIAARRLGGDARIFTGDRATEKKAREVLSQDHPVVHFAGHGFLDAGSIGRSGLMLSPDPEAGDDGLLQARELVDLDIQVDLVVLSGCSTGGGRLVPGEGPMGLPHAFFQAGTPSIVMSLWDIRDRGAAVFMDRFYAGLAEDRSFGDALRAAKLDLLASPRAELRHPSVWAPFVMAGIDDRSLGRNIRAASWRSRTYAWVIGLLLLSVVLWFLSAVVRRRPRSAPPPNGR